MIDKEELINILREQHRELQADLRGAVHGAEKNLFQETLNLLLKFRKDLETHLELENGTFYPDYLKINNDDAKVKIFVAEMVMIGEKIFEFLKTYDAVEKISVAGGVFRGDLEKIISMLNLRIEMEEEGLYDVYVASRGHSA